MQINKLLLPLGAVVVLSLLPPLHAQETDAQAKAREALRQKIAELNTQPQSPAAPAAPVAPAAPAPPVVAAPEPPVVVVAPAAAPVVSTVPAASAAPAAAPMDGATAARAREALRQKMLELDAQAAATSKAAPGVTFTPKPVTTAATPGYQPIQVPASSLSGTKEARLATLLQQYKADQITPEQYHKQRAAIIAEP